MIAENLAAIRARIRAASPDREVGLIAVSKTQPASAIREAYAAGQRDFGENYGQELRDKARELADLADLRWHYIGRLQHNKAKYVAPVAFRVHALESPEDGRALVERATRPMDVLLAVNVADETSKGGVPATLALDTARRLAEVPGVRLRGLFTMPPYADDPQASAPHFARLAGIAAEGRSVGLPLEELSMGMSHDFEVAIAAGATWVRVGTAIFGERPGQ